MRWKNWRVSQPPAGSAMPTIETCISLSATLLGLLLSTDFAKAATVSLTASDQLNYTSFNAPGYWSNGVAPSAVNAYTVTGLTLRTPPNGGNYTFDGNSLTITNGVIIFKGFNGDTIWINNLVLNNASVANGAGGGPTFTLAGSVTLSSGGGILDTGLSNRGIVVAAPIVGSGGLTITDGGMATLSSSNSYSGGTTINATTLQLGNNSALGTGGLIVNNGTVDLATFSPTVTSLSGSAGTITNSVASAATLTVNQAITTTFGGTLQNGSGILSLVKSGMGVLCLTGTNTYSGSTTISGGTIQLGNGGTSGSVAGNSTLNGGALTFNYGAPNYGVNGNITLTADSTIGNITNNQINLGYNPLWGDGPLTGNGHTLTVDNGGSTANLYFNQSFGNALGQVNIVHGIAAEDGRGGMPLQSAAIVVSNGAAFASYASSSINNNFTLNGGTGPNSNGAIQNQGYGAAVYTGTISLNSGNSTIGTGGGNITISGQISGTGALTTIGGNTLIVSGANTYSGGTNVSGGTLQLGNNTALGATSGSLTIASGTVLNINGYSPTVGALSGSGTIDNAIGGGNPTLAIGTGNAGGTFSGVIQNTSGATALTKIGSGNLFLTGANSYTGLTTVNAGTLTAAFAATGANAGTFNPTGAGITIGPNATFIASQTCSIFGAWWPTGGYGSNWTATITNSGVMLDTAGANVNLGPLTLSGGTMAATGAGDTWGTWNLNNTVTVTANSLISAAAVDLGGNQGTGQRTFTVNPGVTLSVTGYFRNGNSNQSTVFGINLNGGGTMILSGSNIYTGATTINAGTLLVGVVNALSGSSALTISGGTLDVSGFANTVASLNVTSNGGLNLGLGNTLTSIGTATLAGNLNVSGVGTLGKYLLLTYTSESGSFASATLDPNYGLHYGTTELDALHKAQVGALTVTAVYPTVITGGTTSLTVNVINSATLLSDSLNFTASASGTGYGLSTTGNLAATNSGKFTIANGFNSTSLAVGSYTGTITVTGTNSTLAGAAVNSATTGTVTVNVLDHSNASLNSTANQTTETINFGNVLVGATVPSQSFTIYNRAANTTAADTANLKLTTGFTTTGDGALTTNLSTFNGLTPNNGNTFTASLNTSSNTTTGIKTVAMSASQLTDDSNLPGAGNNNNGALTNTQEANVGNATADKSNSPTSFGIALTAPIAQNASYANLASTVMATSGSGGFGMVGSTATILAGTNSSGGSQTVSMAWRTQTLEERTSPMLLSDVVQLSGMTLDGTSQTSPFVLEMTYNPSLLPLGEGSQGLWASEGLIYLGWLDNGAWVNAVSGNFGSSNDTFVGVGPWNNDTTLGDWGVNTVNDTVWAVVNHNSVFAVVPEPSTLLLLGVAIGLLGFAWWRRRSRLVAGRTTFSRDETPATLSFPAQPLCWTEGKRRAA